MHTAWIYSKEGNIEHACVLDNKYTPQSSLKNFQNKETTKSAIIPEKEDVVKKLKNTGFPKAEDLKTELLKRHTKDHKQYKKNKEKGGGTCRNTTIQQKLEKESIAQQQ